MSDETKNTPESDTNDNPIEDVAETIEDTVEKAQETVTETVEETVNKVDDVLGNETSVEGTSAIIAKEPAAIIATEIEDDGGVNVVPRGALAFVLLMLIFYAIYYLLSYYEIFILRGA